MDADDARWRYEPSRVEAGCHVLAWLCFLLAVGMAMLRNALAFNLFGIFGIFGIVWLASMAVMVTSATVRTDLEPAWSDKMLRRSWQIYSYALRPWRVIHSLAVIGVGR